jgi:hypothetical protein
MIGMHRGGLGPAHSVEYYGKSDVPRASTQARFSYWKLTAARHSSQEQFAFEIRIGRSQGTA